MDTKIPTLGALLGYTEPARLLLAHASEVGSFTVAIASIA